MANHHLCALYEIVGKSHMFHVKQPADLITSKHPAESATLKIKEF